MLVWSITDTGFRVDWSKTNNVSLETAYSTLVSAMVTCQKAGRSFVLSGVNPRVSKLFEITHVQDLFLVFPTLPEAVTALTNTASA